MTTNPRQRIGLALAIVLSVGNIVSIAFPTPEGETGPPLTVLVAGALLGVGGVVASIVGWRSGSRAAMRVVAGLLILMALGAAPGLFVEIPPALKAAVGLTVAATIAAVALVLSRPVDKATAEMTA